MTRSAARARVLLASIALGAWSTHALTMWIVYDAPVVEGLWMCHVAPLLLAMGCATGSAPVASIGTIWLSLGWPLWLGDTLAAGQSPEPTPALIHIGAFVVGVAAVRVVGWDRAAWWRASLALVPLAVVTRLVPAAERDNINLVFRVWPGWERLFPDHGSFLAFIILAIPVTFFLVGLALGRLDSR